MWHEGTHGMDKFVSWGKKTLVGKTLAKGKQTEVENLYATWEKNYG